MTSITQNPVKFYKYSTKTQYTSDSSNRDSTNGVAFVADEKAIYQGGVKYGADGYTGNVTVGDNVFVISNGLITNVNTPTVIASAGICSTSTQFVYREISLSGISEILNPDTANYDYIVRYVPQYPCTTYPQVGLQITGGSFDSNNLSNVVSLNHTLTSSELAALAAVDTEHEYPAIIIFYSYQSNEATYVNPSLWPNFDNETIQLIKRPKAS